MGERMTKETKATKEEPKETPLIVRAQEIFDKYTPEDIAGDDKLLDVIVEAQRAARLAVREAERKGERVTGKTAKKPPKNVANILDQTLGST